MSNAVGRAQIGQWYLRWDKGELFQVIAIDEQTRTIEIQNFDGDIDEIDAAAWHGLPIGFAEPPEDWTGPVDDVEVDDLGYSETDMEASDWEAPLEPIRAGQKAWQDEREQSQRDPEGEGLPPLPPEERENR